MRKLNSYVPGDARCNFLGEIFENLIDMNYDYRDFLLKIFKSEFKEKMTGSAYDNEIFSVGANTHAVWLAEDLNIQKTHYTINEKYYFKNMVHWIGWCVQYWSYDDRIENFNSKDITIEIIQYMCENFQYHHTLSEFSVYNIIIDEIKVRQHQVKSMITV